MRKRLIIISILILTSICLYLGLKGDRLSVDVSNDMKVKIINSKEYWDDRFKSGNWDAYKGDEQTLHFYTLLVNSLPKELQEEILNSRHDIFDFGCAQGEGTEYFANIFLNSNVIGVDISHEAIKIAKQKNKKASFMCADLKNYNTRWDILISSNTLEHFENPWEILEQLADKTQKYLIILVPFDQKNIPDGEHFYSFNFDNIPKFIKNFDLVFYKSVYPDPKFWNDLQVLLIYKNRIK